jgi:hypothetical protein
MDEPTRHQVGDAVRIRGSMVEGQIIAVDISDVDTPALLGYVTYQVEVICDDDDLADDE